MLQCSVAKNKAEIELWICESSQMYFPRTTASTETNRQNKEMKKYTSAGSYCLNFPKCRMDAIGGHSNLSSGSIQDSFQCDVTRFAFFFFHIFFILSLPMMSFSVFFLVNFHEGFAFSTDSKSQVSALESRLERWARRCEFLSPKSQRLLSSSCSRTPSL